VVVSGLLGCAPRGLSDSELDTLPADDAAFLDQTRYSEGQSGSGDGCSAHPGRPCWSELRAAAASGHDPRHPRDPSVQARVEEARALRASLSELRDVEQRACLGVHEADRDAGPLVHKADIRAVSPLTELTSSAQNSAQRTVGVLVSWKLVPGLDETRLQRLVDCQVARAELLARSERGARFVVNDPLAVPGLEARVTSADDGLSLALRATTRRDIDELLRRTELWFAR
jgi:hypothetical protein